MRLLYTYFIYEKYLYDKENILSDSNIDSFVTSILTDYDTHGKEL